MNKTIEKMRKDGYPYKIKGNGGCIAILYDIQPLSCSDYMAIYRYPGGVCCHDLKEIKKCFEILEQQADSVRLFSLHLDKCCLNGYI